MFSSMFEALTEGVRNITTISFSMFVLSTIGLTNVIRHGKILDKNHLGFRPWLENAISKHIGKNYIDILECYECVGWWSGLITGLILVSFNPFIIVCCAFGGAALGHFYSTFSLMIESKIDFVVSDEPEEEPDGEIQSDQKNDAVL